MIFRFNCLTLFYYQTKFLIICYAHFHKSTRIITFPVGNISLLISKIFFLTCLAIFLIGKMTFLISLGIFPIGSRYFLTGKMIFPIVLALFPIGLVTFLISKTIFPISLYVFLIGLERILLQRLKYLLIRRKIKRHGQFKTMFNVCD